MNHFSAPLLLQAIFSLETVYALTGDALFVFAALTFIDRKHPHPCASGSFWLILGGIFAFGTHLPHWVTGLLVIVMVALDGIGPFGGATLSEDGRVILLLDPTRVVEMAEALAGVPVAAPREPEPTLGPQRGPDGVWWSIADNERCF